LSIIETLVVFVGIPLAVVAVVYGLVFAGSGRSNDRRYRPGRPFEFAPVWFLSAPESQGEHGVADGGRPSVTGANRMALTKAEAQVDAVPGLAAGEAIGDVTGGASDRW
jgi:hypothetical protein